jgi:hypothetical protein
MPYPGNTVSPLFEAATKATIAEERRLERLARCERGEIAPPDVTAAMDALVDEMVYGRGQPACIRRALLKDRSIELALSTHGP